jgi:hypothetical protein
MLLPLLVLAASAFAAAPAEENRLIGIGELVREQLPFAAAEAKASNKFMIDTTPGRSPSEWLVGALNTGDATVQFSDTKGKVRKVIHYHLIRWELLVHLGYVRQLLKTAKGVTVRVVDQKIVIDGKPSDEHARNAVLMVQAAYFGDVLNLATPSDKLCETHRCENLPSNASVDEPEK